MAAMPVKENASEILSQEPKDEYSTALVWGFGMLSSVDLKLLNTKVNFVS